MSRRFDIQRFDLIDGYSRTSFSFGNLTINIGVTYGEITEVMNNDFARLEPNADGIYSISGVDFTVGLNNDGSPYVRVYVDPNATIYSFNVNSTPVEVFVKDDAIYKIVTNSYYLLGRSAGTYNVDGKQLIVSYADKKVSAETAQIISSNASLTEVYYTVGDTKVTVKNATASPTTATVDGHTATLVYDKDSEDYFYDNVGQINATYSLENSYNIELLNEDVITVTVENGAIADVPTESEDNDIVPQDISGRYSVSTGIGGAEDDDDDDDGGDGSGGGFSDLNKDGTQDYTLILDYDAAEKKVTAQAEISPHLQNVGKVYSLKIVDETILLTEDGGKLYRDGKELTNKNGVYTVEASNGVEVDLAFDKDGKLVTTSEPAQTTQAKVGVDLAGSDGDFMANDDDMLTGTLKDG